MSPSTRLALAAWRRIPGPPRDAVKARLLRLHVALLHRFGPQRWSRGRSAFEIAAVAIRACGLRGFGADGPDVERDDGHRRMESVAREPIGPRAAPELGPERV